MGDLSVALGVPVIGGKGLNVCSSSLMQGYSQALQPYDVIGDTLKYKDNVQFHLEWPNTYIGTAEWLQGNPDGTAEEVGGPIFSINVEFKLRPSKVGVRKNLYYQEKTGRHVKNR